MGESLGLGRVRRAHPGLGQRQPIGPATLPRARRRHPHEVDPQSDVADEPGREVAELPDRARAVGERRLQLVRARRHGRLAVAARHRVRVAQDPGTAGLPNAQGVPPELACRDHVDGRSHERRLDDGPVLEGGRQGRSLEAREAGPQPDIPRRRVLGLKPAHLLDGLGDRQVGPLEQELSSEQGALEGAAAERRDRRLVRHPSKYRARRALAASVSLSHVQRHPPVHRDARTVPRHGSSAGAARHRTGRAPGEPAARHGVGAPPEPLLARPRDRGGQCAAGLRDERGGRAAA